MNEPRSVSISFTPREARELTTAARAGLIFAATRGDTVPRSVERLDAAAGEQEEAAGTVPPAPPALGEAPSGAPPT